MSLSNLRFSEFCWLPRGLSGLVSSALSPRASNLNTRLSQHDDTIPPFLQQSVPLPPVPSEFTPYPSQTPSATNVGLLGDDDDDLPVSPLIDIISGSLGGMASVIVGQPFDLVKTRMQMVTGQGVGMITAVKEILRNEGVCDFIFSASDVQLGGFGKGLSPPLVAETLYNCLYFGSFSIAESYLTPDAYSPPSIARYALAGSFSGIVGSIAISPVDLIKIRLQLDRASGAQRTRPTHMVAQIFRQEGLRGMYQGYPAVLVRESIQMGIYFSSYNTLKLKLRDEEGEIPWYKTIFAGGIAGMCTWSFSYPIDVVKTRTQSMSSGTVKDAIINIWKHQGPRGFFRGITPCLARAFPVNATVFGVYEYVSAFLTEL